MLKLYTLIMEFHGGKYISQVYAKDELSAMREWASTLDVSEIQGMGEKMKSDLIKRIQEEEPVKIRQRENVWSFLIHPLGKTCDVDMILTIPE